MHWWTKFKLGWKTAQRASLTEKRDYYQQCIDNIVSRAK